MKILVVEDEEIPRRDLGAMLGRLGHIVVEAANVESALEILKQQNLSPTPPSAEASLRIVLTDWWLPKEGDGLRLVQQIREEEWPHFVAVGMVSSRATSGEYRQAMAAKVDHFFYKPIQFAQLEFGLQQLREKVELKDAAAAAALARFEIVGSDQPPMTEVVRAAERAARTSSAIFIQGETGSGKELLAQGIHNSSPRARQGKLIGINCAGLAESVLESELFGHEPGAFTGANKQKLGLIQLADGGTLFLDEVQDCPISLQLKLLRVLETKKIRRVGGLVDISVNFRLVSAANADPEVLIKNGRIREDFYQRISTIYLRLPSLRERKEHIPLLSRIFLERQAQEQGTTHYSFEPAAMELLQSHSWPRNIRQLMAVVTRVVVNSEGPIVTRNDVEQALLGDGLNPRAMPDKAAASGNSNIDLNAPLAVQEKACREQAVIHALRLTGNRITEAAIKLDCSEGTVRTIRNALRERSVAQFETAVREDPGALIRLPA